MIVPQRMSRRPRPLVVCDARDGGSWRVFAAGAGTLLVIAALCLFLVANLAP